MADFRWMSVVLVAFILCSITLSCQQATRESRPTLDQSAQGAIVVIVEKVKPSTVVIRTYGEDNMMIGDGSGFFVSGDGDIITNRHVLQGAFSARIKAANGKIYRVKKVVAEDEEGDLVRLSVDIPSGVVRPLSISETLPEAGERIVVIGNPQGLEGTVSDGIVSAIREVPGLGQRVQITAPISPGSSGSPVVNMRGQMIGIATSQMVEGQNLNFAVPAQRVSGLVKSEGVNLAQWQKDMSQDWPASAQELYLTGLFFLWAEDYDKAISYFKKALSENPDYAEAYFATGYCEGRLGHSSAEIRAYRQAIVLNPAYADAYVNLGLAYAQAGRHREAVEALRKAAMLSPDDATVYFSLGFSFTELGRYREATEALGQAIRIDPYMADAHVHLGVVYCMQGNYSKGYEAYLQAARIDPDNPAARYGLGVVYAYRGDTSSAFQEYIILMDLDTDLANELYGVIYSMSESVRKTYWGLGGGHWVSKVIDRGAYVKLEDGSLWEVSPIDRIYSGLWLMTEDITVVESKNPYYPHKLINSESGDVVEARLVSR